MQLRNETNISLFENIVRHINMPSNKDLIYQQFWQNNNKEDCAFEARLSFDKGEAVTQYNNNTRFIFF